ncbi:MAG: hypothetical protein ACK5MR_14580 [Cumulibacter sp.]
MGRARGQQDGEARAVHEVVANSPSQIERSRAMRVRDVNRPSAEDFAEVEETLRIVRRNWKPPT